MKRSSKILQDRFEASATLKKRFDIFTVFNFDIDFDRSNPKIWHDL